MGLLPRWAATDEVAPPRPFHDRFEAGRVLVSRLQPYADRSDAIVLGLPRGGVAVAYEVARALHLPLDVFIVRKLGVPGQEELAMGAIASGGVRVLNQAVIRALGLGQGEIDEVIRREEQELQRREAQFRADRPPLDLKGKTVILVDDGLATGATMWAAITAVRQQRPAKIVMAVPVADPSGCESFRQIADDVVCAITAETRKSATCLPDSGRHLPPPLGDSSTHLPPPLGDSRTHLPPPLGEGRVGVSSFGGHPPGSTG